MRISDWSSDVCSSDLVGRRAADRRERPVHCLARASPAYRAAKGHHRMTLPILYHCPDARSLRCLWAAEEAGLDIDLKLLPFPPRVFAPDYRAISPLMTVPGWVENGRLLTESAAICERIAEDTPLEVGRDEPDYWTWRNWLHRSDATLTFPLAIMIRYTRVEPEPRRLAQAVEDSKAFFGGRAKSLEAEHAARRDWIRAGALPIAANVDLKSGVVGHRVPDTGELAG